MDTVGKSVLTVRECTLFDGAQSALVDSVKEVVNNLLAACPELVPHEDHLRDTPRRFVSMLSEMLSGYRFSRDGIDEMLSSASFQEPGAKRRPIMAGPIETWTLCPHHLMPAKLRVWVGYVSRYHYLGLSKLPRLVEVFSKRLLLQEQIGYQIQEALMRNPKLEPQAVYVKVVGAHTCCMARGARCASPVATLSLTGDLLTDAELRYFEDFSAGSMGDG